MSSTAATSGIRQAIEICGVIGSPGWARTRLIAFFSAPWPAGPVLTLLAIAGLLTASLALRLVRVGDSASEHGDTGPRGRPPDRTILKSSARLPPAALHRGAHAADRAIGGKSHAAGYVNSAEVIE